MLELKRFKIIFSGEIEIVRTQVSKVWFWLVFFAESIVSTFGEALLSVIAELLGVRTRMNTVSEEGEYFVSQ